MSERTPPKPRQSKGILYSLTTGAVFVFLVGFADSECRLVLTNSLTDQCVEHLANSGTVSAMYAAVYAILAPQAFRAVFGRLIEVLIRLWARVTGRTLPDPSVSPSPTEPAARLRGTPVNTDGLGRGGDKKRPVLSRELILPAICTVVLVASVLLLIVKPPTPLQHGSRSTVRVTADGQEQQPVPHIDPPAEAGNETRPTSHLIQQGDSCAEIARTYCTESKWRQFQTHNAIRVISRNGRLQCVLTPGRQYALPQDSEANEQDASRQEI